VAALALDAVAVEVALAVLALDAVDPHAVAR
jgi:hypothetical protein